MSRLSDEDVLDLAGEFEVSSRLAVWLPRPGRDEPRCGDSREAIGREGECHLVAGHDDFAWHYDVRIHVCWDPDWRSYYPQTKDG